MSIRAYIKYKDSIIVDGEKYTKTDLEYCFNLWRQGGLLLLLQNYGLKEYVNEDYAGTMELSIYDFKRIEKRLERNIDTSKEDYESLMKIKKYFDKTEEEFIQFECF